MSSGFTLAVVSLQCKTDCSENQTVKLNRGKLELRSDDPAADVVAQLRRFARRAFRRKPDDAELKRYVDLLTGLIADGADPIDALRAGYRAILCSPRFLYFTEPVTDKKWGNRNLDDHAIASRLSYLLWNSMPDRELFELADQGKIGQPEVLRRQVVRMLESPRGSRFIQDFASQWLDLVDIDFTEPDRKLYQDFDIVVQNAMLDETHAYLNRSAGQRRERRSDCRFQAYVPEQSLG